MQATQLTVRNWKMVRSSSGLLKDLLGADLGMNEASFLGNDEVKGMETTTRSESALAAPDSPWQYRRMVLGSAAGVTKKATLTKSAGI